jgi:CRISPR-associated protein Csm3
MHKTRFNALKLDFEIQPYGPVLIKAGGYSADPMLPDMQFVRTVQPGQGEVVYLPGSSLKGVVRSYIERALRTLDEPTGWRRACPTFDNRERDEKGCGSRIDRRATSKVVYHESCGACRLFGNTRLRGRLAFSDSLPSTTILTEVRYGNAISRISQSVQSGALFEMEVAVAGTFQGQIVLENYEGWQLGLLGLALDAMDQGSLRLGFGRNRGFGEVRLKVTTATVEEIARGYSTNTVRGIGAFLQPTERTSYGIASIPDIESSAVPINTENLGFYRRRHYDHDGWAQVSRAAILNLDYVGA